MTLKGGTYMETLNFTFITDWAGDLVDLLRTNSLLIFGVVLVIVALVMGAFFLLGLVKKGVKSAK